MEKIFIIKCDNGLSPDDNGYKEYNVVACIDETYAKNKLKYFEDDEEAKRDILSEIEVDTFLSGNDIDLHDYYFWIEEIRFDEYSKLMYIDANQIRRIDDLGRINIPNSVLDSMEFKSGTPLEIFYSIKTKEIILKPYIQSDKEFIFTTLSDILEYIDSDNKIPKDLYKDFQTCVNKIKDFTKDTKKKSK